MTPGAAATCGRLPALNRDHAASNPRLRQGRADPALGRGQTKYGGSGSGLVSGLLVAEDAFDDLGVLVEASPEVPGRRVGGGVT